MKTTPINNYEAFKVLYEEAKLRQTAQSISDQMPQKNLICLFVASDDPQTDKSWCPDCIRCKPVIDSVVDQFKFNEQLELAIIQVGDKQGWKSDDNPYRLHELAISNVPTLVSLKTVSSKYL